MIARRYSPDLHVGRRAVIDGANADVEELPGDLARFLRDGLHERVVERRPTDGVAIDAGDAIEAFALAPDDRRERFEHGRDQNGPERVRLELRIVDAAAAARRRGRTSESNAAMPLTSTPERSASARPVCDRA